MAKKRLRYIEDLYDFYSNKYKRSTKFSAEKTGEPLVVQVHGRINFDESFTVMPYRFKCKRL